MSRSLSDVTVRSVMDYIIVAFHEFLATALCLDNSRTTPLNVSLQTVFSVPGCPCTLPNQKTQFMIITRTTCAVTCVATKTFKNVCKLKCHVPHAFANTLQKIHSLQGIHVRVHLFSQGRCQFVQVQKRVSLLKTAQLRSSVC